MQDINDKENPEVSGNSEKQEDNVEPQEPSLKQQQPKDEGSNLEAEVQRLKDQILRYAAEADNLRKRYTRELEEANKYAITKFARDLIEVLENLHRAESNISNEEQLEQNSVLKQIYTGVELTKKSLIDAFEKHGIKRLDPQVGEAFNHDYHQAIAHVPSAHHKEGSIIQVIQAGYLINDRLLRPALVAVAKPE